MTKTQTTLLIVAMIAAFFGTIDRSKAQDAHVGTINDGILIGISSQRIADRYSTTAEIIRMPINPSAETKRNQRENIRVYLERDAGDLKTGQPIRWRIVDDVFWISSDYVLGARFERRKVSDFDLFDDNDPRTRQKKLQRYQGIYSEDDLLHFYSWTFERIKSQAEELRRWLNRDAIRFTDEQTAAKVCDELAFFDFLPQTPLSGRLFLLVDGKCRVWSILGEFKLGPIFKSRDWQLTYSKDPVATIDLGFTEPFTVFSHKGSYFFLTRSCKLFSATKTTDDKWKVEKLWSEANRPIHAVITDTKTNSTYAFTQAKADKDGRKPADVYFDFDTKLNPIEFDRGKLKNYQLDPPLDTLRSYTQVLIDAKKIDPTVAKTKE